MQTEFMAMSTSGCAPSQLCQLLTSQIDTPFSADFVSVLTAQGPDKAGHDLQGEQHSESEQNSLLWQASTKILVICPLSIL